MSNVNENKRLAEDYCRRSERALHDAKLLANDSGWDACINRLYYAAFYITYALIVYKLDIRTKTHAGVKTLFNKHFIKEGLVDKSMSAFYSKLMGKRAKGDYDDYNVFTSEETLPLIGKTEAFINTIKQLIEIKQDS